MRKLILQEWLSLDGFTADQNGKLDFFTSSELNKYSDYDVLKFMDNIDTLLLGRVTYELFADFWPNTTNDTEVIADKLNSTEKFIVSNSITKAPWGKWPEAKIIKGDVANEIRNLKGRPGKNIVLWGSISLAQSLIKENLIDEYHLRICPTAIGAGKPLFPNVADYINLRLIECKKYDSGLILLHYEPKF